MTAQHLPRDLVRPSSGFNNSLKKVLTLIGLGALFGGTKPSKDPRGDGTLPYRCSGVPEYASCVDKLRQKVGLQM